MDTATTVAVFSFAGVVVTAVVGAIVAIYTNRAEKKVTAENVMERSLRERITLRDEQIIDLRGDLEEANERLDKEILANRLLRQQLQKVEDSEHRTTDS